MGLCRRLGRRAMQPTPTVHVLCRDLSPGLTPRLTSGLTSAITADQLRTGIFHCYQHPALRDTARRRLHVRGVRRRFLAR